MENLFLLNENITNGYSISVLDIVSVLTVISGMYVIISKNPIISILFLIGLFAGVSVYLMLIGLYFIGLSYLIIYVGAVSILFLFILMLINIRISEIQSFNKNSIPLASFITIAFSYVIFQILPYSLAVINNFSSNINEKFYNISLNTYNKTNVNFINENILFANSNNWDTNLVTSSDISNIGNILYTSYNIWLIITSFILLLAMVGAIVITIKQSK